MPLKRLKTALAADEMPVLRKLENCWKLWSEQTAPFSSDKISSSVKDAFRQFNTNIIISANGLSSNS